MQPRYTSSLEGIALKEWGAEIALSPSDVLSLHGYDALDVTHVIITLWDEYHCELSDDFPFDEATKVSDLVEWVEQRECVK